MAQQQQQLQRDAVFLEEVNMYESVHQRELQLKKLEEEMHEIHSLYLELSTAISQQGEVINSIENAVEKSCVNTEKAVDDLEKASHYQKQSFFLGRVISFLKG